MPVVSHLARSSQSPAALGGSQALGSSAVNGGTQPAQADGAGASEFSGQFSSSGQPHSQWSRVPVAKVTAALIAAAQDAAARAARQRQAEAQQARAQQARAQQTQQAQQAAATTVYRNPLRGVSALNLERIDMGVDFGGAGPVYALGNAVITSASGDYSGWPGGGWITYRLTDGPAAGLMVYVAEDVKPTVQVGQTVTSSTVIGNMFNGGDGIETGWAQPDGSSAESQLPEAGGISGQGPFPTMVGLNFEELLQALGVPAAPNRDDSPSGQLPSNYPTDWSAATKPAA